MVSTINSADTLYVNIISEDNQEMPQSWRTAFKVTKRRRDDEQNMTKQMPFMKPLKHEQRRIEAIEYAWNGQ